MTEPEVKSITGLLVAAYHIPAWSSETIAVYRELLSDLDHDATYATVRSWIMDNRLRPTIADIRAGALAIPSDPVVGGDMVRSIRKIAL